MKKIKVKKIPPKVLSIKIGIILVSLILSLIVLWLGISFITMIGDNPYGKPQIDLREEIIDKKVVRSDTPSLAQDYEEFRYKVLISETYEEDDNYFFVLYDYNYQEFFESLQDAKFEYTLSKEKGRTDLSTFVFKQPVYVILRYSIRKDLQYFWEYSKFVLEKALSIDSNFAPGGYYVNRELDSWVIELDYDPETLEYEY